MSKKTNGINEYFHKNDTAKQPAMKKVKTTDFAKGGKGIESLRLVRGCPSSEAHGQPCDPTFYDFFDKCVMAAQWIPVRSHKLCSDEAVLIAARRVHTMLEHIPHIAHRLGSLHAEVHVIARPHQCSDLPYLARWKGTRQDGMDWDERNRGTCQGLWASCAEENMLELPEDHFRDNRDICTHEFAHTLMKFGVDKEVRDAIRAQYLQSTGKGRWATAYSSTNEEEWFAELSMWYFESNGDFGRIDPKPKKGRKWFAEYDPEGFEFIDALYSGRLVPDSPPVQRLTLAHPRGEFEWIERVTKKKAEGGSEQSESNSEAESPCEMLVFNATGQTLKAFWLDGEGRRQDRGEALRGEYYHYFTYSGDLLLLTDLNGQGKCLIVPQRAQCPLATVTLTKDALTSI